MMRKSFLLLLTLIVSIVAMAEPVFDMTGTLVADGDKEIGSDMPITDTIANLTLEYEVVNDSSRIVKENVIKLIVKATNNGSKTYNNYIKADLYKNTHSYTYSLIENHKKNVTIEIGQQVEVSFEYENLEDSKYIIYLSYYTGTEWKNSTTKSYTVKHEIPAGIQLVGGDADNDNAVIYGLNGNKVAEGHAANVQQLLKSLPKGLYIVRKGQRSRTVRN